MLLLPTIFNRLNEKTLYIFGGVNFLSILIVWALYPESNQRTLEEMDLVFASDSIWNWEAEKTFAELKGEHPELTQAERRQSCVVDAEKGVLRSSRTGHALGEDPSCLTSHDDNKPIADACEETHVEHP